MNWKILCRNDVSGVSLYMNMKQLVTLTLISSMILTGIVLPGCGSEAVEIPDNDLETVIRHVIEKPEGDIYTWELEEITELKASRNDLYYYKDTTGIIPFFTWIPPITRSLIIGTTSRKPISRS